MRLGFSITSFPSLTAVAGVPYQYQVEVSCNCDGNPTPIFTLVSGPVGASLDSAGLLTWTPSPADVGTHVVRVRASATTGLKLCPSAAQAFNLEVVEIPVDPASIAPELPQDGPAAMIDSVSFLFDGSSGIQTGVDPADIDPARVAVLHGVVVDSSDAPIPGVRVTVLGHSEFGQTLTRADGRYDMAVNGGGDLTLSFRHGAYLEAQRTAPVTWADYVGVETVTLVSLDPQVTEIHLADADEMAVASGSPVVDADGARQAVVLFPSGTSASLVLPDGSNQALSTIHVRATEYTVGPGGPEAMPGTLPPTSGYTYCVELSCDEAILASAASVQFSTALPFYVENFIGFAVGRNVPAGYYDRSEGRWVPSANGRVIEVLSVSGQSVELDIDGSGTPASTLELAALGITDEELGALASQYSAGTELWRTPITHFTPWDCNWPYGPPPDAKYPDPEDPEWGDDEAPDEENCSGGSIIRQESQALGEVVAIPGTPYSLYYWSNRVRGFGRGRTVSVKTNGTTLPPGVRSIDVMVQVAGRTERASLSPLPDQTYSFEWDGFDAYGRPVTGGTPITLSLGYTYDAFYYADRSDWAASFGSSSGIATGDPARSRVTLWKVYSSAKSSRSRFSSYDQSAQGLGGWSLDVVHRYDANEKVLHLGSGGTVSASSVPNPVARTIAGNGEFGDAGDGGPARLASISSVWGMDIARDGTVFIADMENCRIRRIGMDGIITTVAGTGEAGFSGDGGPATSAKLFFPSDVVCGPDGSLYIADNGNLRVRKVDPSGTIRTLAGRGGTPQTSGDGGPAALARFKSTWSLALTPDGTLYVGDQAAARIRRIDSTGIIETFAGTTPGSGGDGGPAHLARFANMGGLALAPDGNLLVADPQNFFVAGGNRVRKISPASIIRTVAGTGSFGFAGDGGLATNAVLGGPQDIAVAPDGTFYIAESEGHRIRRVSTTGRIRTLVGTGTADFFGDEGPTALASVNSPSAIAIGPNGEVVFADTGNFRIRRIQSPMPGASPTEVLVPSPDGTRVFKFDARGRHLATWNTITSSILHSFQYTQEGRLLSVQDGDGNTTTIDRDASQAPTRIVAPHGQVTLLGLDTNGYLSTVSRPGGSSVSMTYGLDGLLDSFDNSGALSTFSYDNSGRLLLDMSPSGRTQSLVRSSVVSGYKVTSTSTLGRQSSYVVSRGLLDQSVSDVQYSDGTAETRTTEASGKTTTVFADGSTLVRNSAPDPRFGTLVPVESLADVLQPSGRRLTTTVDFDVALSDPTDPLSLLGFSLTRTVNGRPYSQIFDATTKTLLQTSPSLRFTATTIDTQGRVLTRSYPTLHDVEMDYDALGRLTSIVQGTGAEARSTTYSYATDTGLLEEVTDPEGNTTSYQYDLEGRVVACVLPDGTTRGFSYDSRGNLVRVTPPGGADHSFAYGAGDLQTEYAPPTAGLPNSSTAYDYNADEQLQQVSKPSGESTSLIYSGTTGRLSSEVSSFGNTTYTYEPGSGLPKTITTPGGVVLSFLYDGSLPTQTTWSGGVSGSVTRTFDDDLRVASVLVNGATPIANSYDADGLLTGAGPLALQLDPATGFLASSDIGTIHTSCQYNEFGEIVGYQADNGGTSLASFALERDKLGRIVQSVEIVLGASVTKTFAYDVRGRLTDVWHDSTPVATYTYDSNGNRLTRLGGSSSDTGIYDAQDRLLSYGGASFVVNADGAIVSRTESGQVTTYSHDQVGNLSTVTLPGGTQIQYVYDGYDRRVAKKVGGVLVQGFLYLDALHPAAELDGTNAIVSRFVYASRSHVPDFMIRAGREYRFVTDPLGSVRLVVDVQSGAILQELEYDEFGQVLLDTNPGFQPFGFAGGLYDSDTGLALFGARDYDATCGRWMTKDPILFGAGDTNVYAYCGNDPVNHVDPSGLWVLPAIAAFGVVGAAVGVAGQAIEDLVQGREMSSMGEYGAAAAAGALGGLTMLYTGNPYLAGAVNGLTGNLIEQASGPCEMSFGSALGDTALGAMTGLIPGSKIPGIDIGRGSAEQVYKQMVTKFSNGTINNVSTGTVKKMVQGAFSSTGNELAIQAVTAPPNEAH